MNKLSFLTVFALFAFPLITNAFSLEYAPNVSIDKERVFEENAYILGADIQFDNTLDNDLIAVSGKNTLSGTIFGDLLSVAGEHILEGEVFGDARFIGPKVDINGSTNKDLIVVSADFTTQEKTVINGETFIVANSVNLKGKVLDNIKIIANNVFIDAEILGNTEITAQKVSFGDSSKISGELVYFSPEPAEISSGAFMSAQPIYNQIQKIDQTDFVKRTVLNFVAFWSIIKFLATLFTAFILVYVFRKFSQEISFSATERFGKSLLFGALSLPIFIIAIFILFASLFGIPLAILISFFYIGAWMLVPAVSGIIAGYLIRRKFNKQKRPQIDFNSTALGVVLLTFIYFIPFVGGFIKFVMTILSLGTMILYWSEIIRLKKRKDN
jgi:hypothetical protein